MISAANPSCGARSVMWNSNRKRLMQWVLGFNGLHIILPPSESFKLGK